MVTRTTRGEQHVEYSIFLGHEHLQIGTPFSMVMSKVDLTA
jgi:hypothetical protein